MEEGVGIVKVINLRRVLGIAALLTAFAAVAPAMAYAGDEYYCGAPNVVQPMTGCWSGVIHTYDRNNVAYNGAGRMSWCERIHHYNTSNDYSYKCVTGVTATTIYGRWTDYCAGGGCAIDTPNGTNDAQAFVENMSSANGHTFVSHSYW